MKFGSFDTAIANSKLSYAEKYGKASMNDLNMFQNVLEAQVIMDSGKATIKLKSGYTINVKLE